MQDLVPFLSRLGATTTHPAPVLSSARAASGGLRPDSRLPEYKQRPHHPATRSRGALPASALSGAIKNANSYLASFRDNLSSEDRIDRDDVESLRRILELRMKNAETLASWEAAAHRLDELEGHVEWKRDPGSTIYNPELLSSRLAQLDEARTNVDISAMLYLIRTALSRDLAGMGNPELYRHAHIGSKQLIEQYVDSAVDTICALVEKSSYTGAMPFGLEHQDLLEGLLFSRQSFGRSALLLSGGGTFGMTHIGVVKAMFESGLLPRIISGASAGSIVCSVLCSRTDEEVPDLLASFPYGDLAVFEGVDDPPGYLGHLRRLLIEGSWSDIKHLTRVMRDLLGDITFQEAYNRTRRICNICVSSASVFELPRLLNYVTAPNVMIWSAVAASCSVPLLFQEAPLLIKDPVTGQHQHWNPTPQRWIDGSVDNDLPMTRLAELFNVNHFIVSQVNPHVTPFLGKEPRPATGRVDHYSGGEVYTADSEAKSANSWMQTMTTLALEEAMHRLHFLAELNIFPHFATKLRSVLSQKYSGDINILPDLNMLQDLPGILSNPSKDFMTRACLAGEQATWPKMSRIRDRCAIELALDRAVHALRARVVFSQSHVDLRRLVTGCESPECVEKVQKIPHISSDHQTTMELSPALCSSHSRPGQTDLARARLRKHQRRGSGSGLQLMVRHRRVLENLENTLTDEDTEEDERSSLGLYRNQNLRSGPLTNPALRDSFRVTARGPQLRRAATSHGGLASLTRGMSNTTETRKKCPPLGGPKSRAGVDESPATQSVTPPSHAETPPFAAHVDCAAGSSNPHDHCELVTPEAPIDYHLDKMACSSTDTPSPTDETTDMGDIEPQTSDGFGDAESTTDQSGSDPDLGDSKE